MYKTIAKQLKEFKYIAMISPLFMIGEVICEMIIPVLMGFIVDNGIMNQNLDYIKSVGIKMLLVALLGLFCGCMGGVTRSVSSSGLARNLRKAMHDNIQTFSFANIDKFSTSGLVTRLTTDVTNVQNSFMMLLSMAVRAPMSMIVAMIMSFYLSPRIASIYLVAVVILAFIIFFMMGTTAKYFKEVFEKYDALNESVQENVSAIRVVKAYVREDYENEKFKKAAENIYKMFVRAEKRVVSISPIMTGTVYICILLISWIGAHMVVSSTLTTGALMSLLTYCMNILMSLMMVSMIFVMITMSQASIKRIVEVIDEKSLITNPKNPIENIPNGSVSFEHVYFAYKEDAKEYVLKDINLDIKSGESIGIIGATGSAKSTLVSLISRLYDVRRGEIKVGGINVKDIDLEVLRNSVSVVLQKNELFSGTILDNLRWGNENASLEECIEASKWAMADEFVSKMKDGYNTHIEQGGSNVSGGQKQRLCIARALLKKPKVLILDDSTSAVDTATDSKIREAFNKKIPGTTKFIIAQRISSVMDCDRIIVMNDGAVAAFGSHNELMETSNIYKEVYESQTGANKEADFDN